jgi:hypothetical protein
MPTIPGLAGLVLLAICSTALGQAGSKESQKFLGTSEDSRELLSDARDELQSALSYYNSLVRNEADNPQSAYKGFAKALDKTEKLAAKTRKQIESMQSQAEKVFKSWQKELDGYQSDSMRALGAERLEVTKQRYEQMITRMAAAGEAYDPLITALRDQDLFMGRDLSAEALGTLAPMAVEVNQMADALYARIAVVLEEQMQDEAHLTAEGAAAPKE